MRFQSCSNFICVWGKIVNMFTAAVLLEFNVASSGSISQTLNISSSSYAASGRMGIATVFFVSSGANVSVPLTLLKSCPDSAVPFRVR